MPEMAPSLWGQHRGQFVATPLRIEGARLKSVVIDQAVEVLFQGTGPLGGTTGARAIHQARHALVGKAIDPCTEGGIGEVQRVGDRLETLPCDDGTYRLGTAECPGLFRLFSEGIEGGRASSGKCSLRVHIRGVSTRNYYKNRTIPRHPMWFPYYRSTAFPTQIFWDLLIHIDDGLGVLDIDGRDDVGACGVIPRDDLKGRCGIDTTNQTLEFLHDALEAWGQRIELFSGHGASPPRASPPESPGFGGQQGWHVSTSPSPAHRQPHGA